MICMRCLLNSVTWLKKCKNLWKVNNIWVKTSLPLHLCTQFNSLNKFKMHLNKQPSLRKKPIKVKSMSLSETWKSLIGKLLWLTTSFPIYCVLALTQICLLILNSDLQFKKFWIWLHSAKKLFLNSRFWCMYSLHQKFSEIYTVNTLI